MKRMLSLIAFLLFAAGMLSVSPAADVNVNINAPPPPAPEFTEPPDVVVVPSGTRDVYLVPDRAGLYFYGGHWYRLHGANWFRAPLYSGPWTAIGVPRVPAAVVVIPPEYIHTMPPGYHRIQYADFDSHWKDWGRTRHWQSYDWYKEHSTQRWGGKEFNKLPPGHPGDRWARDRGPRTRGGGLSSNKETGVKEDGKEYSDKESEVKKDGKEPSEKGAGGKSRSRGPYDKGPRYRGSGEAYGKGPGVEGVGGPYGKSPGSKGGEWPYGNKPGVEGGGGPYGKSPGSKGGEWPYGKGPGVESGGGPYGKSPGSRGGEWPYDKRPGIKSSDGVPGTISPGGLSSGGGAEGMKPGSAEPKTEPPAKPE